jgi:hypothetical protein
MIICVLHSFLYFPVFLNDWLPMKAERKKSILNYAEVNENTFFKRREDLDGVNSQLQKIK